MKTTALVLAVLGLSLTFTRAESAADIIKKHESQMAEALDAYLKANPKAADAETAMDALIGARKILDQHDKVAALLQAKYNGLAKGADINPNEYFDILGNLLQALLATGSKDQAKALLATAKRDVEGNAQEERMKQFIDQMGGQLNQPGVGDTLDIAFTSIQGHPVNLAEMKGKVVLVDFWATWCGPCVGELPNVKAAYEKYHDKGFEVVGISLDQEKGKLEEFIKEKNMPWPQDFTGKGWETDLAKKFGITSIPATFLVGKDGKVVASNLRGTALEAALEKALE